MSCELLFDSLVLLFLFAAVGVLLLRSTLAAVAAC